MGIQDADLEELRSIFADRRVHFDVGIIDSVEVALDRSVMRVRVIMLPAKNIVVARMTWEAVGPDAGFFMLPVQNDMVLVGFADGQEDEAFVLKRLTTREDKIPIRAAQLGHMLLSAKSGQETHITSDTKLILDKGGLVPGDEPLVLGNVLIDCLTGIYDNFIDALDKIINGPVGIGNLGNSVPTDPGLVISLTVIKTNLELDKATFITSTATNIVSQLSFTER